MSAVGPWQELSVDVVVRKHAVNDSESPQVEAVQMRYCVTRSVEAIYKKISKGYGPSHCTSLLPVVLYIVPRRLK